MRFPVLKFSTTELHSLSVLKGPGALTGNPKLETAFDSPKGHFIFNPKVALGDWRTWRHTDGAGQLDSPSTSRNFEAQGVLCLKCWKPCINVSRSPVTLDTVALSNINHSQKIRTLPTSAATMLWGCSSSRFLLLHFFGGYAESKCRPFWSSCPST